MKNIKFLSDNIGSFILHESSIEKITIANETVTLDFKEGFFEKRHVQKNRCKIIFFVPNLNEENYGSYILILKQGVLLKEVNLHHFQSLLTKHEFVIDVDYYSEFEKSIMLVGMLNNNKFSVKITDIDWIKFEYDM